MSVYHEGLTAVRFIPNVSAGSPLTRLLTRIVPKPAATPDDMSIENITVPGAPGNPDVGLRIYRPKSLDTTAPALFWMNGGGYIGGTPEQDDPSSIAFARELGITVVALRYRVAPEHPSPAAVEDAYAGLLWLFGHAAERNVDPARIAIGGASAGGGLTASLALYAHDRGEVTPVFQLLVYPMLDDRTVLRTDMDTSHVKIWTAKSNRYAWTSYLGREPGGVGVSEYAAPARREDLGGLPPAWIGVGMLDLFHDEDLAYAARLVASGVPCELVTVPGAFHGFDALFRKASVSKEFWSAQASALRSAFGAS